MPKLGNSLAMGWPCLCVWGMTGPNWSHLWVWRLGDRWHDRMTEPQVSSFSSPAITHLLAVSAFVKTNRNCRVLWELGLLLAVKNLCNLLLTTASTSASHNRAIAKLLFLQTSSEQSDNHLRPEESIHSSIKRTTYLGTCVTKHYCTEV